MERGEGGGDKKEEEEEEEDKEEVSPDAGTKGLLVLV